MPERGWKQLLADDSWCQGTGRYPIDAYSEFMPPPRLGCKACGQVDALLFSDDDAWGWHVTEYEELLELQPGLKNVGHQILTALHHLGCRQPAHGIPRLKLEGNPYWPPELAEAGAPAHERYVVLMPLALSRTQDDKGRVRWTLFGCSEQGPSRAFWKSFFISPKEEQPADHGPDFIRRLLAAAYGESSERLGDLKKAGFRILDGDEEPLVPHWREPKLPSWTAPYLWTPGRPLKGVKYLLTFRPFAKLPPAVRRAYLAGELHLLPFPGSLCFWGTPPYLKLARELPIALQIPLLHSIERHEAPHGIRVPQSGWMHEPHPDAPEFNHSHGPLRNTFVRTHRWAKVHRSDDEIAVNEHEDKVAHVLFSTAPHDLGLYGKPMARNAQIWTHDVRLLLDGPRASQKDLRRAAQQVAAGGAFGYRFLYPAMRVGPHEVYWQRPLVGYLSSHGEPELLADAPLGYLTAYRAGKPQLAKPVELWPRLLKRGAHEMAVTLFHAEHDGHYRRTTTNVRKLLDTWQLFGRDPLERSFARALLTLPKQESLEDWLASLPSHTVTEAAGRQLVDELAMTVAPADDSNAEQSAGRAPAALTFKKTATRTFETTYWKTIAALSNGEYLNKDNADCVQDRVTQDQLQHNHRDLEALGDYLLAYYARTIEAHGMSDRVWAGELPFRWQTQFDYTWQGGWLANQQGSTYERDLIVMIPGRDRRRTVIMADHYDTAYMEDHYGYSHGGNGPRLSAAGADDNHSATAACMLAAPLLMEMSEAGQLACDVWLVHLTGEEFPADCMGARHLAQGMVEGFLSARSTSTGRKKNIGKARVQGVYVMDMIAHNNDRDRDVFQMCPGASRESMWLALQAHLANDAWNRSVPQWNARSGRKGRSRGQRSADGVTLPAVALHPHLHGEVRPVYDSRSTLYNTDGQIFSDAGIPVVLFMENYDINRHGYHDSFDTMANIDLDYGAAVAAICIESVRGPPAVLRRGDNQNNFVGNHRLTKLRPLLVFGTRPEAIKMAPVVRACQARADEIDPIVMVTGQHREMLDQVTAYFGIRPDIDLDLMRPDQTLSDLTARCLQGVDKVLREQRPDCLVAQGDTTTVMAAALAAFYQRVPFVHVEAGLRTGNMQAPWPEELNRRVASLVTALHCAPTQRSADNLLAEGLPPDSVHVTGNTVIDALLWTVERERARSDEWLRKYAMLADRRLVLITGHRRENFGAGFEDICRAIATLAGQFPQVEFFYPVHLNPRVREPVHRLLGALANVHLTEPAAYPEFVWLMDRSYLILTDSGGVQEEAPSLRKPVLVMRDTTERPEALAAGAAELVGTDAERIVSGIGRLLGDPAEYGRRQIRVNPYGDGHAAGRIVDLLLAEGWSPKSKVQSPKS